MVLVPRNSRALAPLAHPANPRHSSPRIGSRPATLVCLRADASSKAVPKAIARPVLLSAQPGRQEFQRKAVPSAPPRDPVYLLAFHLDRRFFPAAGEPQYRLSPASPAPLPTTP